MITTVLEEPTSDCPTGKVQFTRAGAIDAARSRGPGWHKYRCGLCDCYHTTQSRRSKKGRARR